MFDARLQKFVAALELFVLALDRLDAVDNGLQAHLQDFGLLDQVLAGFLAQLVDLFAVPARRHGADVVLVEVGLDNSGGGIARHNHSAAALATAYLGAVDAGIRHSIIFAGDGRGIRRGQGRGRGQGRDRGCGRWVQTLGR